MNSGQLLVNGNDFYVGNGSNEKVQLARLSQVPSAYIHPSTKQCNYSYTHPTTKQCSGGDASTLNGMSVSQIISQSSSGSRYIHIYTGNDSGTTLSQVFTIPFNPTVVFIFRADGRYNNGSNITTYSFGTVSPSSQYFYIRDSMWGIYLNGKSITVKNVYNYQYSGFNFYGVQYIFLAFS